MAPKKDRNWNGKKQCFGDAFVYGVPNEELTYIIVSTRNEYFHNIHVNFVRCSV